MHTHRDKGTPATATTTMVVVGCVGGRKRRKRSNLRSAHVTVPNRSQPFPTVPSLVVTVYGFLVIALAALGGMDGCRQGCITFLSGVLIREAIIIGSSDPEAQTETKAHNHQSHLRSHFRLLCGHADKASSAF
jgi:hypothetical protein